MNCGFFFFFCLCSSLWWKPPDFQHLEPTLTGSTPGTSWDSLPARSSDVTGQHLPGSGLEPGRPAEELREGRGWEFPGKHCSRWPAWLSNTPICSAADGRAIFGKSLLSQVQLVLLFFPPSLINALISPRLLLFLEMRFLFLLQGHDPKDPQSLTHLYTLCAPAFLSSFSPSLWPITSRILSRWSVEYKDKCC